MEKYTIFVKKNIKSYLNMNYIGSKIKLCKDFIPNTVKNVCGEDLSSYVFCDLLAGSGVVAQTFKPHVKSIISNDIEYYSYVINKAYLESDEVIEGIDELLNELNNLPLGESGFISDNYCFNPLPKRNERLYFSNFNGRKIDIIRKEIEEMKNLGRINKKQYYYLIASLIEASDKVANVASVYSAYLKSLKKNAQKKLILKPLDIVITNNQNHKEIEGDIVYLDPPYNSRQYGSNYHLLNTIAEYKPFTPKGITGLREYTKSKFCYKSIVEKEFDEVINSAKFKYIFLSYNNEGLMSCDNIKKVMSKYGEYNVYTTEYKRFKADNNRVYKSDVTIEYLHVLIKK